MKHSRVAVGIVHHKGKILLIERAKEPFKGSLSLPGGKIEPGEDPEQSIKREVLEETGLETSSAEFVGFYDETVFENGEATHRHELHIFLVSPQDFNYSESEEGRLFALDHSQVKKRKNSIIPSDFRMIERAVFQKEKFQARISISKTGGQYSILSEEDF